MKLQEIIKTYMDQEDVRLLTLENETHRVPTLEERVEHAYRSGIATGIVMAQGYLAGSLNALLKE
jgi:hypothetical protein